MNRVFRLGRRRRRVAFVTGLVAVIVLGMALPAWAHHPILSGETECTNGDHLVRWSISNSQPNMPMTITSATAAIGATEYPVTGYSSPVGNGGTTHATTIVPGNVKGKTIELTVAASWPDGVTSTKNTSVDLVDTCVPPTTTTTVGGTTTFATTTTTEGGTTTTTPITGEGSTSPIVVSQATTTTAAPVAGTLPRTGSSSGYAVFFGLSCIAGGALLLIRRRSWER